jgi:hypothetical protein
MARHKRYRKHAQMEAFGLAVIVMLITVGLLLFVAFRNKAPKNEPITTYVPSQMASNFVNSIVSVNVDGCIDVETTVSKLLANCANGDNMTERCNGQEDCPLVNYTINKLLNESLGAQAYSYHLYTQGLGWPNGGELNLTNRECNDKKERVHGYTIIVQETYRTIFLNLDICKQ